MERPWSDNTKTCIFNGIGWEKGWNVDGSGIDGQEAPVLCLVAFPWCSVAEFGFIIHRYPLGIFKNSEHFLPGIFPSHREEGSSLKILGLKVLFQPTPKETWMAQAVLGEWMCGNFCRAGRAGDALWAERRGLLVLVVASEPGFLPVLSRWK